VGGGGEQGVEVGVSVEVGDEVFEDIRGQVAVFLLLFSLKVILSFLCKTRPYAAFEDPLLADGLLLQLRTVLLIVLLTGKVGLRVQAPDDLDGVGSLEALLAKERPGEGQQ
jgi:hypothetical protein